MKVEIEKTEVTKVTPTINEIEVCEKNSQGGVGGEKVVSESQHSMDR
jgi:hypothetical protein